MNLVFSCAIVLHRVFDSAPPEKEPVFRTGGRVLRPYKKPGGVYVFVDEPEQVVEIVCQGYQTERVSTGQGETHHLCLYPDNAYLPPAGWAAAHGHAPPGQECFWPDKRTTVHLLAIDPVARTARLRARPGFIGGCLRLTKGDVVQVVLILGKEPPDKYRLSAFEADFSGGRAEKGYAARADGAGTCVAVAPEGVPIAFEEKGGDASFH